MVQSLLPHPQEMREVGFQLAKKARSCHLVLVSLLSPSLSNIVSFSRARYWGGKNDGEGSDQVNQQIHDSKWQSGCEGESSVLGREARDGRREHR